MDDQIMIIHETPRELVQRVGTAVADPAMRRRDAFHGPAVYTSHCNPNSPTIAAR